MAGLCPPVPALKGSDTALTPDGPRRTRTAGGTLTPPRPGVQARGRRPSAGRGCSSRSPSSRNPPAPSAPPESVPGTPRPRRTRPTAGPETPRRAWAAGGGTGSAQGLGSGRSCRWRQSRPAPAEAGSPAHPPGVGGRPPGPRSPPGDAEALPDPVLPRGRRQAWPGPSHRSPPPTRAPRTRPAGAAGAPDGRDAGPAASARPPARPILSGPALTARVRPERHQHEVVREPRHGEGRAGSAARGREGGALMARPPPLPALSGRRGPAPRRRLGLRPPSSQPAGPPGRALRVRGLAPPPLGRARRGALPLVQSLGRAPPSPGLRHRPRPQAAQWLAPPERRAPSAALSALWVGGGRAWRCPRPPDGHSGARDAPSGPAPRALRVPSRAGLSPLEPMQVGGPRKGCGRSRCEGQS